MPIADPARGTGGPARLRTAALAAAAPCAVFLCVVLWFAAASPFSRSDFPLDDAWIHRVYSRSFAFGHGFEYNAGGGQEAGSTSPLWAVATAPAHWLEPLGTPATVAAVKAIGVLLGFAALVAAQVLVSTVTGSRAVGTVAASLFALEPRLAFSALSGMETNLLLALWLAAACAFSRGRRGWGVTFCSLLPVARPEALALLPVALLFLLWDSRGHESLARTVARGAALGVPAALWSLFCLWVNGHPLPNTFYLKAEPFRLGAPQVAALWQILAAQGFTALKIFLPGLAVLLGWATLRWRDAAGLLVFLIAMPALFLAGVAGTRQLQLDGYYWSRWVDPAALVLGAASCAGVALLLARTGRARRALAALGVCGLALSVPGYRTTAADRRSRLASDSRAINLLNVQAGAWVARNTPQGAVVGVNDAGAIRYFGGRRTIDLLGLNNAAVAFGRQEPLAEIDWLAVFPMVLREFPQFWSYERAALFSVPLREYTVCNNPGQTALGIYRRPERGPSGVPGNSPVPVGR